LFLLSASYDARLPAAAARAAILFLLLLAGCATNPVTGERDLVLVSAEQELKLGAEAHEATLTEYALYPDRALAEYVAGIGQRLAAHSHLPNLAFHFHVLDSPEINAFALPGGYVYITRGLLAYLNSEAELAAVLGHEIGHVTARHGVRQASSAQAASLGAGLLAVLFPQVAGAQQSASLLGTALLRGYGREHELEADRLGAEYLARSGYDPGAMLDVIRTLKAHEALDRRIAELEGRPARAYHGLFATHPDNDTRLKEVVGYAEGLASQGGERRRVPFLARIDGLVFGDNPDAGVVEGNTLLHTGLGFALDFPAGWRLQNQAERILLASPDQAALVSLRVDGADGAKSPADYLARRGGTLYEPTPSIVNGLATLSGFTSEAGGRGQPVRVTLVLLDGRVLVFSAAARDLTARKRNDPAFLAIAGSVRRLDAATRARLAPKRVRLQATRGTVDWPALAASSALPRLAEEQLKLLNAVDIGGPDGVPDPLKVVR